MNSTGSNILVTGASGLLGKRIVKKLSKCNYTVSAIGRQSCPESIKADCRWLQIDIRQSQVPSLNVDILIHAAPLWLLPNFLKQLSLKANIKRCVSFSSTSAESKAYAHDDEDRELANKLLIAEAEIKVLFDAGIDYTIFRPTMIYGYGQDQNISVIAKFIQKRGFFPVAGKANGLRQPVHVDDLIDAAVSVIDNKNTFGKTYSLTGGETLTYKNMVARIFEGLNQNSRIVSLPVFMYRVLLKLRRSGYSSGTANRMNQNLSYNSDQAVSDFNYQAQMFLTNPQRDLSGI